MFKNPGKKLKGLAKWIFWLSLICYVIFGVAVMAGINVSDSSTALEGAPAIVAGVLIILVGLLISWLSAIFVYAAGSVVDDVQTIKRIQIDQHKKANGEE